MNALDLLQAMIMLGLPLAALSWFMFSWLFSSGEIDREDNHKTISTRLKKLKKLKKSIEKQEKQNTHYVYDKWMAFGSGFYGLAGLWTFAVIEISQFFSFIFNFPGFAQLFEDGIIGFIISLLLNQLGNFISACIWFTYWPADSILIWILVAYLGYWVGVEMARRNVELPIEAWLEKLHLKKP